MTKHSARNKWETIPSPLYSNTETSLASSDTTQGISPNELTATKEALRQSKCVVDNLKNSLQSLALDKQTLSSQLQRCQASNAALVEKLALEHADFEARTVRMQHEISVIRSNVEDAKKDLLSANGDLRENLKSAVRTTMRLGLMFMRMREARQKAARRSNLHSRLSASFEATILEQAAILQHMRDPGHSTEEAKVLLFRVHQRCGQLLQQNTSLQLRLTAERLRRQSTPQLRRITRRLIKRLAREMSRQACLELNQSRTQFVYGRRRIPRRLRAHMLADTDITIFEAMDNN